MTEILLYEHPFASEPPKVFRTNNLGQWLLSHYGPQPSVRVQVFAGEPSFTSEITGDVHAIIASDKPRYTVLQSPGLEPFSWAAFFQQLAVAAVLTVVAQALAPSPKMPDNVNRSQESPNNALGSRENKLRYLERVEDIYGTVRAVPSLMMPTYNKYINHEKYEYGYYCVGRGYYDIAEVRDGDTLIADIDGAAASVYDPFTSPNSGHAPTVQIGAAVIDDVLNARRAIEVDGITLKAPNQVQLPASDVYAFTPDPAGGVIGQAEKHPNFNAVASVGDSITVSMANYVTSVQPSGESVSVFADSSDNSFNGVGGFTFGNLIVGDAVAVSGFPNNSGTYTVIAKPSAGKIVVSGGALIDDYGPAATFSVTRNYSGAYTITEVGNGFIRVSDTSWPSQIPLGQEQIMAPLSCSIQIVGKTHYTDWVTLPDEDRTEVWCNVVAQQGMYADDGGRSTAAVTFSIEIERLDAELNPTGQVEVVSGILSGAVADERADTVEHATAWTGPARVRIVRTSNFEFDFEGLVVDEIKWADLYAITPVAMVDFGNKTTLHTITKATSRATAVKTRQLNCVASRKLPIYNGASFSGSFDPDGRHVSGTIAATSKVAHIIGAVALDPMIGRRTIAEIDMAQIWSVQQQLDAWSVECGQFNYTFDSDNISFEETVTMIANAAFCIAYRQNGKIRLAFDRAQANSSALFTHRNKRPNAETITRRFANDADYDGVEFVYVDPDSNQSETIILPLDGSYTKLKKFEIAGIRSFTQAWYRANREYQKLIGQRVAIETETTLDARALLPNSRIDVVDNTRFKSCDGEVIGQNGLELTLSQPVEFVPAMPHSIVLMRRDGSLQSISCTAGSASNKVVLESLPSEPVVSQRGEDGIRTIYSFAADSSRGAMAYLVQEIDLSDGQYAAIRAINYSDAYYQHDTLPVPAKQSVIG